MAIVHATDPVPNIRRARAFMACLALGVAAILARLWYLQIAHGEDLQEASIGNQLRLIRRIPPRGEIVDRHGLVFATDRPRIVVSVVPDELHKKGNEYVLPRLADLLGMGPDELQAEIEANKTTPYDPVRVAVGVDMPTATRLEEQRQNLPGVLVGPEPIRFYPDGPMAGHMLGQLGQISPEDLKEWKAEGYRPGDSCGKLGLERQYDKYLRGTDGGRRVEVDARGRVRREVTNLDPIPGDTLTLNVDKRLEKIAYDELAVQGKKGHPGAVVALDPQTGAVLTLASYPSYNPNEFVSGVSRTYAKYLATDRLKPQINRAVGSGSAPGSTFKTISATAGLFYGVLTPSTRFYCPGVYHLGHWLKHCWRHGGHGSVDLLEAIQRSCDVYFYNVGRIVGPTRLAAVARKYGLGSKTGIDLPRVEIAGIVPDPEWKRASGHGTWYGGETVDYGIGQAMLKCTPIQMCNVAAAIGNGGTLYRPQLVETITRFDASGRGQIVYRMEPDVLARVDVPSKDLDIVRQGMEMVAQPGGTGTGAVLPGLKIGAKTGTAEMVDGGKRINNAWFITFAPADRPRIAICVFIQGDGHGGTYGAPIARKMFAEFFHIKTADAGGEVPSD